jgi:hypothetical protein
MNGDETCTCGHVFDEHGGDEEHPGSSKCNINDCDCVCFEEDEESEEAV